VLGYNSYTSRGLRYRVWDSGIRVEGEGFRV